jgi:hypothetical protein
VVFPMVVMYEADRESTGSVLIGVFHILLAGRRGQPPGVAPAIAATGTRARRRAEQATRASRVLMGSLSSAG